MQEPVKAGVAIDIFGLRKSYGQAIAVDDVTLNVAPGEFLALLGPSGSGKSTVLMSIAGFEFPTSGRIEIGGKDCTRLPPHRRNIGMVFQQYSLFPHLSVLDNVAFPLKMRGVPKEARRRQAAQALETVRLDGYGARRPSQLSGGQQQRVAIARAIVYHPAVLLMDEPLSALDKSLREEMQLEIKRLHRELGITIVFVTHDQGEAMTMADRIAILQDGQIRQIGSARDIYERPNDLFAAGFIGEMNFLPATQSDGRIRLRNGTEWLLPQQAAPVPDGAVTLAIRPESVSPCEAGDPHSLRIQIQEVVYAGAGVLLIGRLADGTEIRARLSGSAGLGMLPGQSLSVRCPPDSLLIYPDLAA